MSTQRTELGVVRTLATPR